MLWGSSPTFFFSLRRRRRCSVRGSPGCWSADTPLDPIRAHLAELGFELAEIVRLRSPGLRGSPARGLGHGVTDEDCARFARTAPAAVGCATDTGESDGRID